MLKQTPHQVSAPWHKKKVPPKSKICQLINYVTEDIKYLAEDED